MNKKFPAVFFIKTSIVCSRPGIPWRVTGSIVELKKEIIHKFVFGVAIQML